MIDRLKNKEVGFWIGLAILACLLLSIALSDSLSEWWFGDGGLEYKGVIGVWPMIKAIGLWVLMCGLPCAPFGVYALGAKYFPSPNVGYEHSVFVENDRVITKNIDKFTQDDWDAIKTYCEFSEYYGLRERLSDIREAKWRWYGVILVTIVSAVLCLYLWKHVIQYSWSL